MQIPANEIFNIHSNEEFNHLALKIFHYQYHRNPVYKQFVNFLFHSNQQKINSITHYSQIPFLPIEMFKYHTVTCFDVNPQTLYFQSSGTTQQNLSKHYLHDEKIYQISILKSFQLFYGHPSQYLFIFLLPTEKDRPHSSLIYMAKFLQSRSKYDESGFYLNNMQDAIQIIQQHININTKIFILGLSYALMDFAQLDIQLNEHCIVMETGGMKGTREELPKNFLHNYLKKNLGVSKIHSEYGMTELLSQAYSTDNGLFKTPPFMKVLVREMDDPLKVYEQSKQGLINIIDLANIHTCSFIATSDIGKLYHDGSFEILGRSDFSDIRGCNLMYQ